MAFSGGVFSRLYDWTTDRDNGVKILASRMDEEFDGMATGLSTCILKDGTQTCTAAVPFAEGLTIPDDKTLVFGTDSDVTIQYDETTNNALEIAANVEGAALGIVLKADQGDDNSDQWKVNVANGGTLSINSKISGSFVSQLTLTPNATAASSTTAIAGNITVGGTVDGRDLATDGSKLDGIEASADVTDTANVTAAGALMDSEVTNLAQVKAFNSADYATAAQGSTADSALQNVSEDTTPQLGGNLDTNGNDINFGDNDKAIFGAGNDLQIYHDGTHSYVQDAGTGDLRISGNNVNIMNGAATENYIVCTNNGSVAVKHDNATKLETSSTGVDVTGSLAVSDATTATKRLQLDSGASSHTINSANYGSDMMDLNVQAENLILKTGLVGVAERLRIDSSGNVGISNTAPSSYENGARELVVGTSGDTGITVASGSSSNGSIFFADGTNGGQKYEGQIRYSHSDNRMMFATGGTGHVFIDSSGNLLVGRNTASGFGSGNGLVVLPTQGITFSKTTSTDLGAVAFFNRNNGDGNLIEFAENAVVDGSITISGTTVSYNGGHLSRWSQAADGNRISGLVKGTVMTNLDQMAVWHHEAQAATYYEEGDELPEGVSVGDEKTPAVAAYDEDNEQLNCMAVSSVEGDANVAGVFVSFDESDDFNDMFVAMTGDMVIRIAQGTTVARGDLLMSAGDGTAKPQGDDIVRSKTIAKVTSTTVSHTYDDGSYLVPCVLMAC